MKSCGLIPGSSVVYTYESHTNSARSHIDDSMVSENMSDMVKEFYSFTNIDIQSNHLCVISDIDIKCEYFNTDKVEHVPRIAWYKACLKDLEAYSTSLNGDLSKISIHKEAVECRSSMCQVHKIEIEDFHDDIVQAYLTASQVLPSTGGNRFDPSHQSVPSCVRPVCSEHCAHNGELALVWHWAWKNIGRPHHGHIANMQLLTRAQYHYTVRMIEKQKESIRSESMAQQIIKNDNRNIWKEAQAMKGKSSKMPHSFDNITEDGPI